MNKKNNRMRAASLLTVMAAALVWAPSSLATLILQQNAHVSIVAGPASLGTTPVVDPLTSPVSTIPVAGGHISLHDQYGNPLSADADPGTPGNQAPSWWDADGIAYMTSTSTIWVDFINLSVTGFTFNIGASADARAWIRAYYDTGNGVEQSLTTGWFNGIGPSSTPTTPSYGVYAAGGSCTRITRVEVDPAFVWGIGNLGLATADSCSSVPEPGMATLLGLGLMAMGLGRYAVRRKQRAGHASAGHAS